MKKYLSIFIFILFTWVLYTCKNADSSKSKEEKLSKIFKDKLVAQKSIYAFRMAKLRKMPVRDTIIGNQAFQKDRIEFLRLIVETNYYNLQLKSENPKDNRNTLRLENFNIELADPDYKYGRNKNRKYCDEDILQLNQDFNEKWPPQKVPTNTDELYDYYYYKSEVINYLLQNKCY